MRTLATSVLTVLCLSILLPGAWADGGMFPTQRAGSAASADQRAIVVFDGTHETLILQTAYEGDAPEFAWVIPVPGLLSSASTIAPDVFDDLYLLTEPAAYGYFGYRAQGLLGCSSSSGVGRFRTVRVWDILQVDNYELTILSAGESSDLEDWLNANGYSYPAGHQDKLDYYVSKSWFFVAAKIRTAAQDGDNATSPPGLGGDDRGEEQQMRPLRFSFATAEPVYPLRISAASSKDEVEVLLYVIARHRITPSNYNSEEVKLTADFRGGDFPAYYEQQFRASLARAGAGSLLVEYAGQLPAYLTNRYGPDLGLSAGDFYITRLRTYMSSQEMEEDVVMTQAAADDNFSIWVAVPTPTETNVRLAAVGLLLLLTAILTVISGISSQYAHLTRMLVVIAIIVVLFL